MEYSGSNALTQFAKDILTKVKNLLSGKQDKLTAGTNITIENGVISATGGESGTVGTFKNSKSTSARSLSANAETELTTLSLEAGVWVMQGTVLYRNKTTATGSTNTAAGYRAAAIFVSGSSDVDYARQKTYAAAGNTAYVNTTHIVKLTATTTYALAAASGTAVGVSGYYFNAVRII